MKGEEGSGGVKEMSSFAQDEDALDYPFERIPSRIFLDTNIIDTVVKYGEYVFEERPLDDAIPTDRRDDVLALCRVFTVGQRACWDLRASSKSFAELSATPDTDLRERLLDYGLCLVDPTDSET